MAEYIDLLQLDVARNKKYRMDAEERERVVTKGFMEREMRYAQEMRELENLLAKSKADKDELLKETLESPVHTAGGSTVSEFTISLVKSAIRIPKSAIRAPKCRIRRLRLRAGVVAQATPVSG